MSSFAPTSSSSSTETLMHHCRRCSGYDAPLSRRDLLSRFGSGLGGIALATLLSREASAARGEAADPPPHHAPKAKRVVQIFLQGGLSTVWLISGFFFLFPVIIARKKYADRYANEQFWRIPGGMVGVWITVVVGTLGTIGGVYYSFAKSWLADVPASAAHPMQSKVGWFDLNNINCGLLGAPLGFIVMIVVSLMGKEPSKEMQAFVDEIRKPRGRTVLEEKTS